MNHICIPKSDFLSRLANIQTMMRQRQLDALLVYGDEYRKEASETG